MDSPVRQFWLELTTSFWIWKSFLTNKFCARSSFCLKPRPINLSEIHRGIIPVAAQTFLFRLILWSYRCLVAWSGTVYLFSLVFHNVNSLYNFVTLETRKSSSKLIRAENKNVWLAINQCFFRTLQGTEIFFSVPCRNFWKVLFEKNRTLMD